MECDVSNPSPLIMESKYRPQIISIATYKPFSRLVERYIIYSLKAKFLMRKVVMFIKTKCGLEKYEALRVQKGITAKLRLFCFVLVAAFRDFNKKVDHGGQNNH